MQESEKNNSCGECGSTEKPWKQVVQNVDVGNDGHMVRVHVEWAEKTIGPTNN